MYCFTSKAMIFSRDIPMPLVSSGVEHGNLRELALARMKDLGTQCRDVRTREVGIQEIHNKVKPYEVRWEGQVICFKSVIKISRLYWYVFQLLSVFKII